MHSRLGTFSVGTLTDGTDARILVLVARTGTFTEAAEQLGLNQTTVSRRVGQLEHLAGQPLFRRTRRGVEPTDAGRLLIEAAERVERAAQDMERAIQGLNPMRGSVTVAAGEGIINYLLLPRLEELMKALPGLSLRLTTVISNTPSEFADISIVATPPGGSIQTASALRQRFLGRMTLVLHASRSYVERWGAPTSIGDLDRHHLVDHATYRLDEGLAEWNRLVWSRGSAPDVPVTLVDGTPALHTAIASGLGIGLLPTYSSAIDPRLVPLPVGLPQMAIDLRACAHEDVLRGRRARAVFDLLVSLFQSNRHWFAARAYADDHEAVSAWTREGG